jgi:hypothetical protein
MNAFNAECDKAADGNKKTNGNAENSDRICWTTTTSYAKENGSCYSGYIQHAYEMRVWRTITVTTSFFMPLAFQTGYHLDKL